MQHCHSLCNKQIGSKFAPYDILQQRLGNWRGTHRHIRACQFFEKIIDIEFRKKSSGQIIDFCATNSTPPSVFTFLVGKLPNFCLKDPVAKGGSKKKWSNIIRFLYSKWPHRSHDLFFKNLSPQTCKVAEKFAKKYWDTIPCQNSLLL